VPLVLLATAVAVAVLVVAADDEDPGDSEVATGGQTEVGSNWAEFSVIPLTPRAYPSITWTGREVLVNVKYSW
jgi:hypothetical protein